MNKVCLVGRLTTDVELKESNNKKYAKFSLAVNRVYNKNETDFISCVAWEKTAELISKYMCKGSQIGIEGRIQTGNYDDKDGNKRYTTDVIVENITFIDSKKNENAQNNENTVQNVDPFTTDVYSDFGEQINIDDDSFLD